MGGISLDTETTGLDLYHGAQPYLVTVCYEDDLANDLWKWPVDPETRQVQADQNDLEEIQRVVNEADYVVMQNAKFDIRAMQNVDEEFEVDWSKLRDTQLAGHLLYSSGRQGLTEMAAMWLETPVDVYEDGVGKATRKARTYVKSHHPTWRIAAKDLPEMPSAKEKTWKFDMWLMDALGWWEEAALLDAYANSDSTTTMALHLRQFEMIRDRGLEELYKERLKVLPVIYEMEEAGVTLSGTRLNEQLEQYRRESAKAGGKCRKIADRKDYELTLPKSGNNKSLLGFIFHAENGLRVTPDRYTKKGNPSLDSDAVEAYLANLRRNTDEYRFFEALQAKRKRDTAVNYMESYKRFRLSVADCKGWYRLYPSLNPTGTDTLRWSSSNPNEQNISKKEGFNLRYAFGPSPGREWWALDYNNIELRIPAYESGEEAMIEIFENPDKPPYFGSYHLLNASIVYPDLFWPIADQKGEFKRKYASTYYQWIKNFGFAVSYGAMESSGTADKAAHKLGAQKKVMGKLKKHTELNNRMIEHAEMYGYVETIPDKDIDPSKGYPLQCPRSNYGKILPTVPLNYHVQGTACWVLMRAMIDAREYLNDLNRTKRGNEYRMICQVHDELVFDFPYKSKKGNLPKIRKLRHIMESKGKSIGIPLTCGIEYHAENWAEGE